MKFERHPLSKLWGDMPEDQFAELCEDIRKNGQRLQIIVYGKEILDGWHRYRACQSLAIGPKTERFNGTAMAAAELVASLNGRRRNLSDARRAYAITQTYDWAASLDPSAGKGDPGHPSGENPKTNREMAALAGTSERTIQRAKKVQQNGSVALNNAFLAGDVSLKRAASVVDLPKREQLAAAQNGQNSPDNSNDFRIEDYNEAEDEGAIERCEQDWKDRVDKAMHADDKLAEALNQLKIQAGLLSAAIGARDHYQRQAGEATRLLKAAQRKIAAFEKRMEGNALPQDKAAAVQ